MLMNLNRIAPNLGGPGCKKNRVVDSAIMFMTLYRYSKKSMESLTEK